MKLYFHIVGAYFLNELPRFSSGSQPEVTETKFKCLTVFCAVWPWCSPTFLCFNDDGTSGDSDDQKHLSPTCTNSHATYWRSRVLTCEIPKEQACVCEGEDERPNLFLMTPPPDILYRLHPNQQQVPCLHFQSKHRPTGSWLNGIEGFGFARRKEFQRLIAQQYEWMNPIPLTPTLKNGEDGKFYVMGILPH